MTERVVTATEFKAKCPAYLDEIEHGGAAITITRRGRPVAYSHSGQKDCVEIAAKQLGREG